MTIEYKDSKRIVGLEADFMPTPESTATYQVTDTSGTQSLYQNFSQAIISAQKVGSGSVLVGKRVSKLELALSKSGSPTGTATAGVFNSSGELQYTFGTIDVSTLTGSAVWYTFNNTDSTHVFSANEYFGISYNTGGNSSNKISVYHDDASPPFDGTNSVWSRYNGSSWTDFTSVDNSFKLYLATDGSKPTNVQDNSLLVEKDTARRYWFSEVETHTDTFDGVGWSETGSQYTIDTANNEIDYVVKRDGSDHYVNKDLQNSNSVGSNLSDDYFRVRWHMANSGYSTGGTNCSSYIGVRSVTGASSDSQDALVFKITSGDANTIAPKYSNGTDIESGTNGSTALSGLDASLDKYFEIERTSPTSVTFRIFPNDTYGTADNEQTFTISSSYTGFRYFSMMTRSSSSQSPTMTGSFDGLEIISGTDTWTMPPTHEIDLSTSAGWTQVTNTNSEVTGGELIGLTNSSSTNGDGIWKDSGISFSDTAFVFRCKFQIVAGGGGSGNANTIYFGISDTNGATSPHSARDGFAIAITNYSNAGMLWNYPSGSTWDNEDTDLSLTPSATTYYLEIKRTSPTSVTFTFYDDSEFSSVVRTHTQTIPDTLNGLKYILVQTWRNGSNNTTKIAVSNMQVWNGVGSIN